MEGQLRTRLDAGQPIDDISDVHSMATLIKVWETSLEVSLAGDFALVESVQFREANMQPRQQTADSIQQAGRLN